MRATSKNLANLSAKQSSTPRRGRPARNANPLQTASKSSNSVAPASDAQSAVHHHLLMPAVEAAYTLYEFSGKSTASPDFETLIAAFAYQGRALKNGDLTDAERMLMAQATTLDVIFNQLARRAAANLGEYIQTSETYLRLAMKAQSQCRATLETLAAMKNPTPVAFVRQANIANGHQQVNNTLEADGQPRTRRSENESQPNEVLEVHCEECLDPGTPQAPV